MKKANSCHIVIADLRNCLPQTQHSIILHALEWATVTRGALTLISSHIWAHGGLGCHGWAASCLLNCIAYSKYSYFLESKEKWYRIKWLHSHSNTVCKFSHIFRIRHCLEQLGWLKYWPSRNKMLVMAEDFDETSRRQTEWAQRLPYLGSTHPPRHPL